MSALRSWLLSLRLTHYDAAREALSATAIKDIRKSKGDTTKLHGAVLTLAAIAMTQPYDLPAWLPDVLVALSAHFDSPDPVGKSVKYVFSEFRRTHQDRWTEFRARFTEDQLDAISVVESAPAYFA